MSDPLWERLLVAGTGPVLTAALALVLVNQIASMVERRREASEVRENLAAEMTETANSLYFALQTFWRAARLVPLKDRKTASELQDELRRLDEVYLASRIKGQTIERRLLIYYRSPVPAQTWHRTFDLLTVRYFLLFEHDSRRRSMVRARNSGRHHSGLSEDQLNEPSILLETLRESIGEAAEVLWKYQVDRQGKHLRSSGEIRSTWNATKSSQ